MLFLVFVIFLVAALVMPLAQEISIVRVRSGIAGILLASLIFSVLLAYMGFNHDGVRGALALGLIGSFASTLLITVLSVLSALNDNTSMRLR